MKLEHFQALAMRYGADITRWPTFEQLAAQRLAAEDAQARAALAQAAQLDAWLDNAFTPVPAAAVQRVTAATLQRTRGSAQLTAARGVSRWLSAWPAWLVAGAVLAGCATARERPQWLGLAPVPTASALVQALDMDGSRF
jgi:hypothetical protein